MEKYTGFHSTITPIDLLSQSGLSQLHYLDKRYGPKAHGFKIEDAQQIVQHMRTFSLIAAEVGIPVVKAAGHVIYKNGHEGMVDLAEYVPNVGHNLLQVMEQDVKIGDILKAGARFEEYLSLFRRVWNDGFRISLDPPLTNFCVDEKNTLWYVDCMPPRQKLPGGSYISEWPNPPDSSKDFIVDRYFSPRQARIIYAQALLASTTIGISSSLVRDSVINVLGDEAQEAITINSKEQARLLTAPCPTDVDLLRIMASEKYDEGALKKNHLDTVYKLCHIGIGGILPTHEEVIQASLLLK